MPERPELHAVVEVAGLRAPGWIALPPEPRPGFVRLWAETPGSEIALLMAVASGYGRGDEELASSAKALLHHFPEVLPGGIAAVVGSRRVLPGCCCGLESWREWLAVLHGGSSPWTGHDPAPLVEVLDHEVHVWSDGALGKKPEDEAPIRFTRVDFERALVQLARDLEAFRTPLRKWLDLYAPEAAKRIVERFDTRFVRTRAR